MKHILIFSIALAACAVAEAQNFSAPAQAPVLQKSRVLGYDEVLAVVEDTSITRDDMMRAIAPFVEKLRASSRSETEFRRQVEQLSREILQDLIDKVILVKEFNSKGMKIPQSALDSIFEDDLKKRFNGDRSEFIKYLQSQNKTIKQYRKEQEESIIVNHMQNQQKMTASEVSPQKIIEYYEQNKQKWFMPESVKLSQITIKGTTPDDAMARAKKVCEEIQAGMKFEDAAKKYSQDETASKGGDWGWYKRGELNPLLDEKAFKADIGKISEPLLISNYAYILRIDERKKEGIQPLDDVREKIEWTLASENAKIEYEKWLKRLRSKAYIKIF